MLIDVLQGLTAPLLLLVIIGVVVSMVKASKKDVRGDVSFFKNKKLLTNNEEKFLIHLNESIGEVYYIATKVRIADVIRASSKDRKAWLSAFRKMSQKHFDFVLVRKTDFEIRYAVELDDSSHNTKKVKARDDYVSDLCIRAGLPLVRFSTGGVFDCQKTSFLLRDDDNEINQ